MPPPDKQDDHAKQNAAGWTATIAALVAALDCDYDRLEELRDEREALAAEVKDAKDAQQEKDRHAAQVQLNDWDAAYKAELDELTDAATVDGELMTDADSVRERIQESPLSVQVRSGWGDPGDTLEAEEFEILLSTGGLHCASSASWTSHKEPDRAWPFQASKAKPKLAAVPAAADAMA